MCLHSTRHEINSTGSSCYELCHMPYTTYGLLRALRSQSRISSPSVAESVEERADRNACNGCHLEQDVLAWTSDYLEQWYGDAPESTLTEEDRTVAASLLWLLKGDAGTAGVGGMEHGLGTCAGRIRDDVGGSAARRAPQRSCTTPCATSPTDRSNRCPGSRASNTISRVSRRTNRRDAEGPGALAAHAAPVRPVGPTLHFCSMPPVLPGWMPL